MSFLLNSLKFSGHLVTADGIKPDTEHLQAITQAPPPKDATTLCSFLGMLSWYGKFIPNYATVVEPLRACLRQNAMFEWNAEAQECFLRVKQLLIDGPVLVFVQECVSHAGLLAFSASQLTLNTVLDHSTTQRIESHANLCLLPPLSLETGDSMASVSKRGDLVFTTIVLCPLQLVGPGGRSRRSQTVEGPF
uniref:Reverse transcriptase/retrotransposon-derived protein RNase H-like domain-containing protein n=1 Tax=Astyanax mexicanus TaxID=7994 RepID=A0A8B9KNM6_ASTMX